jgi:nucleotide-binding universal stress UspA family protein
MSTSTVSSAESQTAAPTVGRADVSGGMLIGIDGSPGSLHALRWAAGRTDRFGPIRLLTTWHMPWWAYSAPIPPDSAEFRREAEQQIRAAMDEIAPSGNAGDGGGGVEFEPGIVSRGAAGTTLVDVGANADLIVVGTRGRSGLKDSLLGSVSSDVVARSTVPVAVVPAEAPLDNPHGRVVIGVDGSIASTAAMLWAAAHVPDGSIIELVHGWSYPAATMSDVAAPPSEIYQERAQRVLDDALRLAKQADAGGSRQHRYEANLVYGDPRSVLADRAKVSDLLVLGARSHRGVSHLLLGSVTTSLVHQPTTTTIVVPVIEH